MSGAKNSLFIIALVALFSCETRTESLLDPNTGAPLSEKGNGAFGNETQYNNAMKQIDDDPSLSQIRSLSYSNDAEEKQSVSGLIDEKGEILKLTQEYTDAKGTSILLTFYFKNNKLISALNKTIVLHETNGYCKEVKSYFGENETVAYSCTRKAKNEEKLKSLPFLTDKKYKFSYAEAMEILGQTGRFETRYLSFMGTNGKEFIVVGSLGKDAYYSVLALQPAIKAIELIQADSKKYLNKRLKIEFADITEANGLSFQGLLNAEIIQE